MHIYQAIGTTIFTVPQYQDSGGYGTDSRE